MDVANRNTYYNAIYEAIIVNDNTDSDPDGLGRVQIYIPYIHIMYADTYTEYMNSSNKEEEDGWNIFPWAVVMAKNYKNGNVAYCSNINNENNKYIILGLDAGNPANTEYFAALQNGSISSNGVGSLSGTVSGILGLTMPIIARNEIGIATNDWPDNIATSRFTSINPYDNGGWSIGLIQWHHARAFDCLFQIAKASESNFNNILAKYGSSVELAQDLQKAVKADSSSPYRTKYQDSFHPTAGTNVHSFIQEMLGSPTGKKVQIEYASSDTENSIKDLTNNYNITNPAIIIFLADIMNQYGPGITKTKKAAASFSTSNPSSMMTELNSFRDWCANNLGSYNLYINRRNNTYAYIENLYITGKLNSIGEASLIDMENANQGGKFLWPAPGCQNVSQKFKGANHTGVDLTTGKGDSTGENVIAIADGTVTYLQSGYRNAQGSTNMASYGNMIVINFNNGYSAVYAHLSQILVKNGDNVSAGQVVGKVGNTGNSYGAHLHFELRTGVKQGQGYGGTYVDPIPYIRKS